jgi:hypothetical protein
VDTSDAGRVCCNSALVGFCGATYELTLAPPFRIGCHPTFSAVFLDTSLSTVAILFMAEACVGYAVSPCYPDRFIKRKPRFARGILPDSRLRRQIDPGGLRPLRQWRSAARAAAGNAEPGSRLSRGPTEWLFLFDGHFGRLNYRKDGIALFEIHSLHGTSCDD